MRILLLGATGQLGWEAHRSLSTLGEVIAFDYPDVDFTQPEQLYQQVVRLQPQVILNAVAYTAVDRAETEVVQARLINSIAPGKLAEAAALLGAVLIHFSTDYVFDGKKGSPYRETDAPNPLNVYGQTKLEGEQAIQQVDCAYLTLRTSWVYSNRRDSFVSKVIEWSEGKPSIRIVSDQIGNPTWARMLAEVTAQLLSRGGSSLVDWVGARRGVYHLAGNGKASRFEWAQAILKNSPNRKNVEVIPAFTQEFSTAAERPLFSALECGHFEEVFDLRLPPWEQALCLAMQSG